MTRHISGRVTWPSMNTSSQRAASMRLYALVLMLCPRFSRRAVASPARGGSADWRPLMISSFAEPARLALAMLAKCSELFLLHAADCVDGGLLCENEGWNHSRLERAIDIM